MISLYTLLENHLPDTIGDDLLEFIGKIVDSIIDSGEHDVYVKTIIMTHPDITLPSLRKMKPTDQLELFVSGLAENKILKLRSFIRGVQHGGAGS